MKRNKNITSDVLRGTGRPDKNLHITPSMDIVFDNRGEEVGRYRVLITKMSTLILL